LHRPVGKPLCERTIAIVETLDRTGKRAVGVGVLLEDAEDDVERGSARRCDHRRPRTNSS
jgi:hypothetical protein